jgi:hypothetical protein
MDPKRRPIFTLAVLVFAAAAALAFSACGEEHGTEAVEGQPLELGELVYNVQITRFLNPDNVEDANYLEGQPEAPPGEEYLGVFIRILNESDEEAHSIPDEFEIIDTRGTSFEALETESPFALEFGAEVPPDGEIPAFDTPARSGPIKGAMLLFLVSDEAVENRPIALEIPAVDGAEAGSIDLDL